MTAAAWTLAGAVLVCPIASAQTASGAARVTELEQQLALYKRLVSDWAGLSRYGSESEGVALDRRRIDVALADLDLA